MKTVKIKDITLEKGQPKICLPITGITSGEIEEQARELMNVPRDIIEWRADWFEDFMNLTRINEAIEMIHHIIGDTPLLFTIRTANEGGQCSLSFDAYQKLLLEVCKNPHVDAIDVEILRSSRNEIASLIRELKKYCVVIASSHDFQKTPDKGVIIERLIYMQKCGADVCKMAVMPQSPSDVLTLLSATNEAREQIKTPIITMSMGTLGLISRICGEVFGSVLTFGCVGNASAPGQMNAAELETLLTILHPNLHN